MQSIAAEQQHFCTAEPGGRSRTLLRSGDDTDECTRGRLRCSRVIRVSLRRRRNACVKSAARASARTSGASAKVRSAEASLRTRYSSASHTHARTTQGASLPADHHSALRRTFPFAVPVRPLPRLRCSPRLRASRTGHAEAAANSWLPLAVNLTARTEGKKRGAQRRILNRLNLAPS